MLAVATSRIFSLRTALTAFVSIGALSLVAPAATINVNSNSTLTSALSSVNPGDTIVLANGTYAGFTISSSGTASAPVTIQAASQGGATISSGIIHFSKNSYVTVQGLTITTPGSSQSIDGASAPVAVWFDASGHCRLSRCTLKLAGAASGIQWVTLSGASDSNRVDHSEFGPSTVSGVRYILPRGNPTIPGVTPPSDRTSWAEGHGPVNPNMARNTLIDHNYFHDKASGTAETIALGAIGVTGDYQNTNSIVEYNLFVNCDGDPEIITTKSSSNIIRYNTFRTCYGTISLRAGNNSAIYGNIMLQGDKSGSGGIKLFEKNHVIYNNYIENVDQYPILVGSGDPYSPNSGFTHAQVFDAIVVNNTLASTNSHGFALGYGAHTLGAVDSVVANNIITGSVAKLVEQANAPTNMTYSDNIAWPTAGGALGITATSAQFRIVNPQLATVNGLQKLSSGSPAIDAGDTTYTSLVVDDIDGQPRDTHIDIGADEFSSAPITRHPLTTADVGPLSDLMPQAVAPVFSPAGGTYAGTQTVTITSASSGISIRYTTDGSTPGETTGTLYAGAVSISSTTTLKAIAYGTGFTDSSVSSVTYTITLPQAAAPVFSPGAGTYTSAQTVAITSATSGASIHYTTDGSTPTSSSGTIYSSPVSVGGSATLKAIASKGGFADSSVTSATYTINLGGPPPTVNFEAESISPVGTGATVSISNDVNASGGVVEFLNSTAAGQIMTFTTPSIVAGTYQVQLRYKTNTSRGEHTVQIDGTQIGGTINQYSTTVGYTTATLGTVTFSSAGAHTIAMTVTGKVSASTQFYLTADKFTFVGQ